MRNRLKPRAQPLPALAPAPLWHADSGTTCSCTGCTPCSHLPQNQPSAEPPGTSQPHADLPAAHSQSRGHPVRHLPLSNARGTAAPHAARPQPHRGWDFPWAGYKSPSKLAGTESSGDGKQSTWFTARRGWSARQKQTDTETPASWRTASAGFFNAQPTPFFNLS